MSTNLREIYANVFRVLSCDLVDRFFVLISCGFADRFFRVYLVFIRGQIFADK